MSLRIFFLFFLMLGGLFPLAGMAQSGAVKGRIKDDNNQSIAYVKIALEGETKARAVSDSSGNFFLTLPSGDYVLVFQHVSFDTARRVIKVRPAATEVLPVVMKPKDVQIGNQVITDERDPTSIDKGDKLMFQVFPIDPKKLSEIPSPKRDEGLVVTLPGVAANNEFSSQYRVRGGNFDENLIYVNDIEVYRPFLIRSGQQEGLGFINSNLASEISFSTGGFDNRYADKLSSVLDVRYKTPSDFHGSAELGILTQNFHLEGSAGKIREESEKRGFTWIVGARRFAAGYLLNSLDTQGEYKPQFYDLQSMLTWTPRRKSKYSYKIRERKSGINDTLYVPNEKWKVSFFTNIAYNNYYFEPAARETQFGTVQKVLRLRVAFAGAEITDYFTTFGALAAEYRPTTRFRSKFILTGFRSKESEEFDVEGGYWLSDVNTNYGNEGFNESVFDRGVGTFYRHARNYLDAKVLAFENRSDWFTSKTQRHRISFGLRGQGQFIEDQIKEWNGVDSADFFTLKESILAQNSVNSVLLKAFVQDVWKLDPHGVWRLIAGTRAVYNSLNNDVFVTPRVNLIFDPSQKVLNPDSLDPESYKKYNRRKYQLRFAAGMYNQPPFYRELRTRDGLVHPEARAQSSLHLIAGADYQFQIWRRPFKFYGEVYYKYLSNLIPYEIDNVRIRYYPLNPGVGYAYGMDLRLNGEFIKDVDSWMSLSLLRTMEDVTGDTLGYIPRPTDQRFSFSMYFQDELPINPTYKVHLNIVYGSGLRVGPPGVLENRTVYKAPAYQRVDLGFSKMILLKTPVERKGKFGLESLWISLEIFNLFQRANTVSYTWIKDVYNTQFAVPNYLSSRLINLRLLARF